MRRDGVGWQSNFRRQIKQQFERFYITVEGFLKPDQQDIVETALEIFRISKPVPVRRLNVCDAPHRLFRSCTSRCVARRERARQSIGIFESSTGGGRRRIPRITYSWLSLALSAVKGAYKPG